MFREWGAVATFEFLYAVFIQKDLAIFQVHSRHVMCIKTLKSHELLSERNDVT